MAPLMNSVLEDVRDARSTLPRDPAGVAQQDQAQSDWNTLLDALGLPLTAALGEVIVAASAIMAKRLDELVDRAGVGQEAAALGHAVMGEAAFVGLSLVDAER